MLRRSRIPAGLPLWPSQREDVPRWLEQHYGIRTEPNPLSPEGVQPDPSLPGLQEARGTAIEYALHRDAGALRTVAARTALPEVAVVNYRRSLKAALAAVGPLRPSERKKLLARFVRTFREENRRQASPKRQLPLIAIVLIAWWEGYLRRPPTKHTLRTMERLLQRHT